MGAQRPRVEWIPPGKPHPDQVAALEFCHAAGLEPQEWQEHVLANCLLEKRRGKWASFENGLVVPRQNGKTELAIMRMLAGVYVLGERLVVYTAHLAKTSEEVFRRTREKVESVDWLAREVKHVWRANGRESIELMNGARILFQTRTPSSGRGFAKADCVILDEAMYLGAGMIASIIYILGRADNPQLYHLASAVDQVTQPDGVSLAAVRKRGLSGGDESLAYFEWSMPFASPFDVPAKDLEDPAMMAIANPALGYGLPLEQIENEYRATADKRIFAIERGGVGDWPDIDGEGSVISLEAWRRLADENGEIDGNYVFAFDVSPDRAWASIAVAGTRADGLRQVEVAEHRRGTGWVVELLSQKRAQKVTCDAKGPAGSLIPALEAAGVVVEPVSSDEHAKACGLLYDAVSEGTIRHLGDPLLSASLAGARKRPLGDRWAWARGSGPDISPLVAVTLALWGLEQAPTEAWIGGW